MKKLVDYYSKTAKQKINTMKAKKLILADGRILAYEEYGAPNGHPIFYAHGGPGSRYEGILFHEEAQKQGLRLVCTDRPGMGESSFLKNRSLLDYPRDICALADHLMIDKFGVLGWSGGGAHTIVCAYAIPERLTCCVSCSGYTNFAELPNAIEFLPSKADQVAARLSQKGSLLFQLFFYFFYISVRYFPKLYFKALHKSTCPADQKLLENKQLRTLFLLDQKEAIKQKGKGVAMDSTVHYVDWGFKLAEISQKVIIFHGTEDTLVPYEYAQHLKQNIPNCILHTMENHGHLYPLEKQKLIFETILNEI